MESQRTPSSRGEIAPFFVMEVMRAAEERELAGGQVLHLEVGQPSTPAPAGVIEAAHRALDEDVLGFKVEVDEFRGAMDVVEGERDLRGVSPGA